MDATFFSDHPRIRGEHRALGPRGTSTRGSSPHTRGARQPFKTAPLRNGIIPAYAGSTSLGSCRRGGLWDHPRIRGEHQSAMMTYLTLSGSSPHTRGARRGLPKTAQPDRIIPAYAGSTRARRRQCAAEQDHPRIRGEHRQKTPSPATTRGSSPHTRGARELSRHLLFDAGIIPAYAGSTLRNAYKLMKLEDHPRIRGEHVYHTAAIFDQSGSSPHTRGARYAANECDAVYGIIPAYAGSTSRQWSLAAGGRDHPRIRGEHAHTALKMTIRAGSSPHTRGALASAAAGAGTAGIIPAYAGSTRGSARCRTGGRDHPRIRGEHVAEIFKFPDHPGSSPHTRGAPSSRMNSSKISGIIPAYAGSTVTPP